MTIKNTDEYKKAKNKLKKLLKGIEKAKATVAEYENLSENIRLYELALNAENFYQEFKGSKEVEKNYPGWTEKYKQWKELYGVELGS